MSPCLFWYMLLSKHISLDTHLPGNWILAEWHSCMQESSNPNRYFLDGELIAMQHIFSFVFNMLWVEKKQTGGRLLQARFWICQWLRAINTIMRHYFTASCCITSVKRKHICKVMTSNTDLVPQQLSVRKLPSEHRRKGFIHQ